MWKASKKIIVDDDSVDFRFVIGMQTVMLYMYKGIYCIGIYSDVVKKTFLEKERYYSFHECFDDFCTLYETKYNVELTQGQIDQLEYKAEDRLVREC